MLRHSKSQTNIPGFHFINFTVHLKFRQAKLHASAHHCFFFAIIWLCCCLSACKTTVVAFLFCIFVQNYWCYLNFFFFVQPFDLLKLMFRGFFRPYANKKKIVKVYGSDQNTEQLPPPFRQKPSLEYVLHIRTLVTHRKLEIFCKKYGQSIHPLQTLQRWERLFFACTQVRLGWHTGFAVCTGPRPPFTVQDLPTSWASVPAKAAMFRFLALLS